MSKIKIALLGCGKQAPKHISGLRAAPDVEVVLADIKQSYAESLGQKEGLSWLASIDDVFADPTINAIDICTPTPSHGELIRSAIQSGKHFFCEKPLAENLEEVQAIEELVRQSNLIGMVGYIYRFASIFEEGKRLLTGAELKGDTEALGKVFSAHFRLGGRGSHQAWKHRKGTGGGAINEMLVHMIDLAIWYFGQPETCELLACDLLRKTRLIQGEIIKADAEDYVLVRLAMKSGVIVYCQADLITPAFTQFIEVQGEHGTFVGSIQPHMPSYLFIEKDAGGHVKGKTDFSFGPQNLFVKQMAEFVDAVRSRRQPSRSTVNDSLLLMETMELLRKEIHI